MIQKLFYLNLAVCAISTFGIFATQGFDSLTPHELDHQGISELARTIEIVHGVYVFATLASVAAYFVWELARLI